jgi:transcription elongation factor Elf1
MKKRPSMFMFGIQCVRCNHEIIAPHETELLDDKVIRHLWHCPSCEARFESFPRFPKDAKSVREGDVEGGYIPALDRDKE